MSSTRSAASRQQSLFDPKTGALAGNIRDVGGDDSELRESLKEFGWVKEFPALVDENGVVLVGHRRMKIAEEENIEPVVKKLAIGNGKASDAERLKLAIVSNIGSKPMTPEDRNGVENVFVMVQGKLKNNEIVEAGVTAQVKIAKMADSAPPAIRAGE
jgi:hypothetical protein